MKFQGTNISLGEGHWCCDLVKRTEQEGVDSLREVSLPFSSREKGGGDVIFQSPSLLLIDLLLPFSK